MDFTRPAEKIKARNVPSIPQTIFRDMKKYEDSARGFDILGFEHIDDKDAGDRDKSGNLFILHRPQDLQVQQIYRMPRDPSKEVLERLTFFDASLGRVAWFRPIPGDDWRGVWRGGGAIMGIDPNGNEAFQLWRYWEDSYPDHPIPRIEDEIDNAPGIGRSERLTDDKYKNANVRISDSGRLLFFSSTKENGKDTLIYNCLLKGTKADAANGTAPFRLPSRLIAPAREAGTTRWFVEDVSPDDRLVLLTEMSSTSYQPLFLVELTDETVGPPMKLVLPGSTEKDEETSYQRPQFSRDPSVPNLIYLTSNGFGNFRSVVTYDLVAKTVLHVTTPEAHLKPIRSIPWDIQQLQLTPENLFFHASVHGWSSLFVMPLKGEHRNKVIEIKLDWEGGWIESSTDSTNKRSGELALKLASYKSRGHLAHLDVGIYLSQVQKDEAGEYYIKATALGYRKATIPSQGFPTHPPKLVKFKSFDGLEIPALYYHPTGGKTRVPIVVGIHGGPESQATTRYRVPIHDYMLNELGLAVIYPNVRGSSGYGKRYLAADDVEKREDSVKDIESLLDHIKSDMQELDADRVAVMGGSYGGYMVFACLAHFSNRLKCGLANFGIAHWPSFLENTADYRRSHRRKEYGDESDPSTRAFLESISPLNLAERITAPLSIAHGETDRRVPVQEALQMFDIVSKRVHTELMICENEGHGTLSPTLNLWVKAEHEAQGFKQKSVIEYTNAAKLYFLRRFLLEAAD